MSVVILLAVALAWAASGFTLGWQLATRRCVNRFSDALVQEPGTELIQSCLRATGWARLSAVCKCPRCLARRGEVAARN